MTAVATLSPDTERVLRSYAPAGLAPWPKAPRAPAFHGPLGEIVRALEPHSEADPAALLLQLLAAFGNVIGRGPGYRVEGDFHATNLYVAIVGDTAKARKGTSWGRVRQVLELVDPSWAERRVLGGLSSGEGLVHQVRDPLTRRRRAKASERTSADDDGYIEELEDAGEADKRLLVQEGELAQALKVMAREGNTLSVAVRLLWDRGNAGALTRSSPVRATGALVSIVGHIVAEELKRGLTSTEVANGFANRFLFACARRSKLLPDGGELEHADLEAFADLLRGPVAKARTHEGPLTRTAAAGDLWHRVYPDLSEGRPGLLGAVTARAEAQVLRLSLLYALADSCDAIGLEHLEAALAVWDYCERSAAHIFGGTLGDDLADRIQAALEGAGEDGLTRTAIRELVGGRVPADRIAAALGLLERRGLAALERFATGGRPVEKWRHSTDPRVPYVAYVPSTLTELE